METFFSILPILLWLAIFVLLFWITVRTINKSIPNKGLERRVEVLEQEIKDLKNKS
ncbi:hypothetical protein LG329_16340 [Virgibacillus necropolis]|uniref:hypothetical protein n=1 Tax=Virgibacillus necropolis TaxID=163877 RepID=UPI00384FF2FE